MKIYFLLVRNNCFSLFNALSIDESLSASAWILESFILVVCRWCNWRLCGRLDPLLLVFHPIPFSFHSTSLAQTIIYVCMYVYVAYVCVCMCLYMYACMYIYIYIYIHLWISCGWAAVSQQKGRESKQGDQHMPLKPSNLCDDWRKEREGLSPK